MTHSTTKGSFCVYKIRNTVNDRLYIGVTSRKLSIRWKSHIYDSRTSHLPLYRAMRKYGIDSFSIEEIEKCPDHKTMLLRERYWIEHLNTMTPNGYNNTAGGDGLYGMHHSEETKKKISAKTITPEFRERMREIALERASNPEYIEKLSRANTGKHLTDAAKEKLRTARSKQIFTPDVIEKRTQKIRGMKHSEEARANMSKAQKGRHVSDECKEKLRKINQILTDEQAAIIKFDAYGMKQTEYAKMFGISVQAVNSLVKGRTYRYITCDHLPKQEGETQ